MSAAGVVRRYQIEVWDSGDERLLATAQLFTFTTLGFGHLRTDPDLEEGAYTLRFPRGGRRLVDITRHQYQELLRTVVKRDDEPWVPE